MDTFLFTLSSVRVTAFSWGEKLKLRARTKLCRNVNAHYSTVPLHWSGQCARDLHQSVSVLLGQSPSDCHTFTGNIFCQTFPKPFMSGKPASSPAYTPSKMARKTISVDMKMDVLKRYKGGEHLINIVCILGLPPSTVRTIITNSAK